MLLEISVVEVKVVMFHGSSGETDDLCVFLSLCFKTADRLDVICVFAWWSFVAG